MVTIPDKTSVIMGTVMLRRTALICVIPIVLGSTVALSQHRSIVASDRDTVTMTVYNAVGGCDAEQCPIVSFSCTKTVENYVPHYLAMPNDAYRLALPYVRLSQLMSSAGKFMKPDSEGGLWKVGSVNFNFGSRNVSMVVRDLLITFSNMDGYSIAVTADTNLNDGGDGIARAVQQLADNATMFTVVVFGVSVSVERSSEHQENFKTLVTRCANVQNRN
jgi:hypothetical protein